MNQINFIHFINNSNWAFLSNPRFYEQSKIFFYQPNLLLLLLFSCIPSMLDNKFQKLLYLAKFSLFSFHCSILSVHLSACKFRKFRIDVYIWIQYPSLVLICFLYSLRVSLKSRWVEEHKTHKLAMSSKILKTIVGTIFPSCILPIRHHASSKDLHFELIIPLFIDRLNLYYNLEFVLSCRIDQVSFWGKHYSSIVLKLHLQAEALL